MGKGTIFLNAAVALVILIYILLTFYESQIKTKYKRLCLTGSLFIVSNFKKAKTNLVKTIIHIKREHWPLLMLISLV